MFEDFRIKVFLTAAREGSFTAAARKLGITQPAVSQNIAEIEKGFGIQLFDRKKGSMELTRQGKVFWAYAERIHGSYEELEAIFSSFDEIDSLKVIRIAVDAGLVPKISSELLPYIYSIAPKVAVAIMLNPVDGADMYVTLTGGKITASPSASFLEHPIWPLIRARFANL